MYTLVRRFIKTGIVFLFAGLGVGAWVMVRRELFGAFPHPHLVSAHTHAVQVGFVMFLILGVALWLFPRAAKDDTRYTPERIEAAYWILAASTGGRFLGEIARVWTDATPLAWVVVLGGLGQIAGLGLYFWTMWSRIRPVPAAGVRERSGSADRVVPRGGRALPHGGGGQRLLALAGVGKNESAPFRARF